MAGTGRVVVYRPLGGWRDNRGRPDVRVNGRVRGQLAGGGSVEFQLPAGEHRVQVGREVAGSGRMVFFGSPTLTVDVNTGAETRVRVEPSGIPMRRQVQLQMAESTYRLSVDGIETAVTQPPDITTPSGSWALNPMTRGLIDRPRPWRSWQAVVTVFMVLYSAWQLSLAIVSEHIRAVGWVWLVFIIGATVWTIAAWISLFRVRRRRPAPSPVAEP